MLQSPANKSAKAKGEVDEDSDNEEAIERDVKDADSFSMNDLISLAKSQRAGGSRSKVWFGVWKAQLNLPSIDEVVLADDDEHGQVRRNIWHAGMDSRPVLTIVLKY